MGKHSQYGVIIDAGSSGSRVYVYKWKNPARASKKADADELHSLPKLKLEKSKKIHPGVSTFAQNVASIGPDHLQGLIDVALDEVPEEKIAETPVFLLATAGVRFLPKNEQTALLQGICTWLKASTKFALPDCDAHIQVIPGETEGLYGWIAANYLLGGFDHPQSEQQGSKQGHHHTYGFLDMGGASAQIAFAPNATEAEKHADDLKLVRMRHLDGTPAEYRVFTTTWLGFGANKARDRYVESLQEEFGKDAKELPDPCLPAGLRTTVSGELVSNGDLDGQLIAGTGHFDECLRKTYPLLGKDMPCEDSPCLINGQHAPAIDFDVNRFVGVSEYWHTTHGVFGGKKEAYDLATYQHKVMDYCSSNWDDILDDLDKRKKTVEEKAEDARQACFKASWLINMLYDGIGIPRLGLEDGAGHNVTSEEESDHHDDSFRPIDKVDGVEVSWTLGKMVLYAAGQVSPDGTALPVGFGSNVASGTPEDFEEAGSIPLISPVGSDDDDDDDDFPRPNANHFSGLLFIIILLLIAWYFLRKPETRKRLLSFTRRRRPSASSFTRRPVRGFPGSSLANKLLGRAGQGYERVMEEGEAAAEFELGGVDSDDNEHSDSSEGSRAGRSTPSGRLNAERFNGELGPQAALDRKGLAVRTESRDRLATVGRRSRTGSPQRSKSSLMTPLED